MTGPVGTTGLVDLHMHSTASDGSRSPADVVRAAKRADLVAIALTDHDTVGGLAEARAAGEELGVRIINGVELSAVEGDNETHLLGLHLSDTSVLERGLTELREMRGRPHVARALVADGWAVDVRDAFDRYLAAGRSAYVAKDQLGMRDAIAMVHAAGGLAVLAHPGASATRERLEALLALGLDGVEIKHPSHSPQDTARIRTLSEQLGLLPSGGSDWHGAADGPRTIGMMHVPIEWLTRQEERVEALRRVSAA